MNKTELIDIVADKTNAAKTVTSDIVGAFLAAITEAVAKGDNVQLIGFGTFTVQKREARTGRNPQTGQDMAIEEKTVVRFKSGATLTAAANRTTQAKNKNK